MNFKIKTMNTKQKVQYWLEKYSHLKDNDNALCANIWNDEIKKYIEMKEIDHTESVKKLTDTVKQKDSVIKKLMITVKIF